VRQQCAWSGRLTDTKDVVAAVSIGVVAGAPATVTLKSTQRCTLGSSGALTDDRRRRASGDTDVAACWSRVTTGEAKRTCLGSQARGFWLGELSWQLR
jgi:hypothetical protein